MKKILNLVLVMLFILSMAASAATTGAGGTVLSNLGAELLPAGGGFDVTLSKESSTMIKAKIALTGNVNYVTSLYCAISFDNSNLTLVDAANFATEYTATVANIKDAFAQDLCGEKSVDWLATPSKFGIATNGYTRGYVTLGFIRASATTVSPRTFEGKDWYNIYFKVKNGVDINATNFGSYFWVPYTSGSDVSKIIMTAPGATASESATITTPYDASKSSGATIQSVNFERIAFEAPAANKITTTIGTDGKVAINGAKVLTGATIDLGTATTATIEVFPNMGYQVASATLGGTSMGIDPDGGKFDATGITGTKALVVSFATRTDVTKPQAHKKVFKEAAVTFPGVPTAKPAVTSFASKPAGATEFGVKLTNASGDVIIPGPVGDTGPMFKSKTEASAANQYGIQFIGLPAGTYTATPYAIVSGATIEGTPVTFVVE